MLLQDLELLSRLVREESKNQHSPLKGKFTRYITRRMKWHAYKYYLENRDSMEWIPLDDVQDDLCDMDAESLLRYTELIIALRQQLPRLTKSERNVVLLLMKMTCYEIARSKGCTVSNVYKTRRRAAEKLDL